MMTERLRDLGKMLERMEGMPMFTKAAVAEDALRAIYEILRELAGGHREQ